MRLILRDLNVQDRRSLLLVHRALRPILRGRPLQLTHQTASGGVQKSLNKFGQPIRVVPTRHWLGGRCYGSRFPGQAPCRVTPQTNVRIANCTGIPISLDRHLRNNPCRGSICRYCVISISMFLDADERTLYRRSRCAQLCRECELFQVRRYPDGLNTCNCRSFTF